MTVDAQRYYSPEEYLELDRKAEFRSEFVNGELLAMGGATLSHNRINRNLSMILAEQLNSERCEFFTADLRVKVNEQRYAYPDTVVVCGGIDLADERMDLLLNPTVIFEVSSPSTEADDHGWKWAHYRRCPSLLDYVLIAQDRILVQHYSRFETDIWSMQESDELEEVLRLPSIGCELPLARIYNRIEFIPNPRMPHKESQG